MKQTLWTIQHLEAYRQMKEIGVLRANEQFLFCKNDFKFAYDWMAEQMRLRVGEPPANVIYPIWAWYQWEGQKMRRDLRFSGYAERGTPMVQIEFSAEEKFILLSDFDEWHSVLSNTYIADNEQDFEKFYNVKTEDAQLQIISSWEKIFDMERYSPNWISPPEEKSIQANIWEIHISQIIKVDFFTAK